MKIDYKILWLDDKMEVIIEDEHDKEVEEHLDSLGFNPIIDKVSQEKDFFEKLDNTYDLILTDYHLNQTGEEARDGDVIVKEVRAKSIFTEIMFYSAQGEVVDTVKLDRITFVDTKKIAGSGHVSKVVTKAKELIDLTVKKFQHIVSMRGMIMHETSSLDEIMLNTFMRHSSNSSIFSDDITIPIFEEIIEHFRSKSSSMTELKEKGKFTKLLKDNYSFSSEFKIKTLELITKNLKLDDFSDEYKEEIIKMRNKFAHSVLHKDANGREFFKYGSDGLTFDAELCAKIRRDIKKHKENLDNFSRSLDQL